MMKPSIGNNYWYDNKLYHCQDVDHINKIAKIGMPDNNNIIWGAFWIEFEKLSTIKHQRKS